MDTPASQSKNCERITKESALDHVSRMKKTALEKYGVRCKYQSCSIKYHTQFEGKLHEMHAARFSWFCGLCGHSDETEQQLHTHFINLHTTPRSSIDQFTSIQFALKCPVEVCQVTPFETPAELEEHIQSKHTIELPFVSPSCSTAFASEKSCDEHENRHVEYIKKFQTPSLCCRICGSLNLWCHTAKEGVHSHISTHTRVFRTACKECLMSFKGDVTQKDFVYHYNIIHSRHQNGSSSCLICDEQISEATSGEHGMIHHMFNYLGHSEESMEGQMVVSAIPEMKSYRGLKEPHLRDISVIPLPEELDTRITSEPSSKPRASSPGPSHVGEPKRKIAKRSESRN